MAGSSFDTHLHPLTTRDKHAAIAYLDKPISVLNAPAGLVSVETFLQHVQQLAQALPDTRYSINLCHNRYLFLVSFCAVLLKDSTNLLPPNKNVHTQEQLQEIYGDVYIIHDGTEVSEHIHAEHLLNLTLDFASTSKQATAIDLQHIAAITFTSGSTGASKPILKPWRTLVESSKINARHMLAGIDETVYALGTIPAQHMWGLETTALLALFAKVCITPGKPLFPRDIFDQISQLPQPRLLVTTPIHLRALEQFKGPGPTIDYILCATSPLSQDLATAIEHQFSAELREVYGCSEAGSMSLRKTARESSWQRFTGLAFVQKKNDAGTLVEGSHLPETVTLQDHIQLLDNERFILSGRASDMINIAGKRGSLGEINQVLLKCPALIDGVVFCPDPTATVARLAAVVVLHEGASKEALRTYLARHLDGAFIPRPILLSDKLPREENGKLPLKKVMDLYRTRLNPPPERSH